MQQQEEKTEAIYGVENVVSVSLHCFARAKASHDSCGDFTLVEGGGEEEYYGRSVMSAARWSSSVSHFSQM